MTSSWISAPACTSSSAPAAVTIPSVSAPPAPRQPPVAERRPHPLAAVEHELLQRLADRRELVPDRVEIGDLPGEEGGQCVVHALAQVGGVEQLAQVVGHRASLGRAGGWSGLRCTSCRRTRTCRPV
jgi:hypothetical protein